MSEDSRMIDQLKYLQKELKEAKEENKKNSKIVNLVAQGRTDEAVTLAGGVPSVPQHASNNLGSQDMQAIISQMQKQNEMMKNIKSEVVQYKNEVERVSKSSRLASDIRSLIPHNAESYPTLNRIGIDHAQRFIQNAINEEKNKSGLSLSLADAAARAEGIASNLPAVFSGLPKEVLDEVRKKYENGEYEVSEKDTDKKKKKEDEKKDKSPSEESKSSASDTKTNKEEEQSNSEGAKPKDVTLSSEVIDGSLQDAEVDYERDLKEYQNQNSTEEE